MIAVVCSQMKDVHLHKFVVYDNHVVSYPYSCVSRTRAQIETFEFE